MDVSELVTFQVGREDFAVDIRSVREIRGWTPATLLPHAPPFITGVINLRGIVLSVVDLAARLGATVTVPTARHVIIVVQIGEQIAGLLVDAVTGILSVDPQSIRQTPQVGSDYIRDFIEGVVAVDDQIISVVHLGMMLPRQPAFGGERSAA